MESDRFDALAHRLASASLTRTGALRGIVAGVAALTGVAAVREQADTKKSKKNVCHCPTPDAQCNTLRVSKRGRRAHLRNHPCDYAGACRGTGTQNPCDGAGAPITIDIDLLGTSCTVGGTQCGTGTGLECVVNVCLPISLGDACVSDDDCSTGRCQGGQCDECPDIDVCESGSEVQCCVVDATCIAGLCVLPDPPGS